MTIKVKKLSLFLWQLGLAVVLVAGLTLPAAAQVTDGSLTGVVTDPTGAVIPDAEVKVTNDQTNFSRTVRTGPAGRYRVDGLPIGSAYRVEVSGEGFKTAVRTRITIHAGVVHRVDVEMELGARAEVITVDAAPPLVNTEDSRPSVTVVGRQVEELPLNGRNVYNLIQMAPGAVNVAGVSFENGEETSVNGLRQNFNGFLLNGVSNKGLSGGSATLPNPDIIAEFQMLTLNMSAQYGNSAASITNLVTKSGTNDFHGSAFYFFRDESLDATEFFRNQTSVEKAPLKFNQFGATATGPIIKDTLFFTASYQGSRFETQASAEPTTQETAAWRQAVIAALPGSTAAFLYSTFPITTGSTGLNIVTLSDYVDDTGGNDFSSLLCPDDISGFGTNPAAATAIAQQFQTLFGVEATDLFTGGCASGIPGLQPGLIPRTTPFQEEGVLVQGTQGRLAEQSVGDLSDGNEWSARIDWTGDKHRMFGEFYWQLSKDTFGPANPNQSGTRGFDNPAELFTPNFSYSWVYTVTPTLVNDLRVGFVRVRNDILVAAPGVPNIAFDDGSVGIGSYNGYPQFFSENIYTYSDMISLTKGNHNMKFGAEFRDNRENSEFNVARPSYYFFDPLFFLVDAPYEQVAGVDPGIVSGRPAELATNNRAWFNVEFGAFFQDDWKVSPNLTLNMGIRYDLFQRHKERFDRETVFFLGPGVDLIDRMANANIAVGLPGCSTATGQDEGRAQLAGECGPGGFASTNQLGEGDHNNWGPRLGVAWDPMGNGKMVIRGGYGISYEGTLYNPLSNSRWNLPFYSFNLADNFLIDDVSNIIYGPTAIDANGLPILDPVTGLPTSSGAAPTHEGPAQNPGQGVGAQANGNLVGWDPNNANLAFLTGIVFEEGIKDPWIENWHVGVQYEFLPDYVVEVNYVATRGHDLFRAQQVNRRRGVRLDPANPAVVNGTFTTATGDRLTAGNNAGSASRFLNANYGTMRVWQNVTRSWYDSLQVSLRKAMSHGIMFNANYTWAHSIDTGSGWHSGAVTANGPAAGDGYSADLEDPDLDRGNSTFDIRHRFVGNYVWDLPFGENATGAARHLLGGWQINGIVSAQSGAHFSPTALTTRSFSAECDDPVLGYNAPGCLNDGGDWNLDGERNDRPNPGPSFGDINPSTDQWANGWFPDPSDPTQSINPIDAGFYSLPCLGCNGIIGRNTLEGPGHLTFDFSLFKNVNVTESIRVQFRFELFNMFNRTNFLMPSTFSSAANRTNSDNFGKAAGTLNPRQIQLGLKLIW